MTIPTEHPYDPLHEAQLHGAGIMWAYFAPIVERLESDCDRYYRAACNGGFGNPIIKKQGRTFAELETQRNGGK